MKRQFAANLACAFVLLAVAACSPSDQPSAPSSSEDTALKRPNIVLVLFEDMSPRVGSFGDPIAHTPHFDRIAAEGVRYTSVFTTSGVCAPSRASLITGAYQQTIGAQHMRTTSAAGIASGGPQNYLAVPPPEVKAFPELLRAAGYHTSNDSKTDYQFGEPFSIWDVSGDGADWSGRAEGQPFFHMRTFFNTHESATWPVDRAPSNPVEAFIVNRNTTEFADREDIVSPEEVMVPPYLPDTPDVRQDIATHYNNIAFTDISLGALYDRLAAEGLLEDTILIVSTDHGDGLPRMKRSLYDSGLHVPMVIRFPDQRGAGTEIDELISFVDLAPTVLSWAGTPQPDWLHGQDFDGEDRAPERTYVFAAQDRMDSERSRRRAVRDNRFKYIRNYQAGDPYFEPLAFRDSQPSMQALWTGLEEGTLPAAAAALFEPLPTEQLYDTDADPHEVRNLASVPEHAEELARLAAQLDAWMTEHGDMSSVPEAQMILDMWPGGEQPITADVIVDTEPEGDTFHVALSSQTAGASIGFQLGSEAETWTLYDAPLSVPAGTVLRAKAQRYGYAESDVVETNVTD